MSTSTILTDPAAQPFVKSIFPVFEPEGKRRRMIGLGASLNGNILTVPGSTCPALFASHGDAERALNAAALELIEATQPLPFEPTTADIADVTREYVADVPSIAGVPVELVQEIAALVGSDGPARLLQLTAPGGFEQFHVDLGAPAPSLTLPPPGAPNIAELLALAPKYNVEVVGPPPTPNS